MTAKQAFDILVQATGQINANRETHVAIQQALDVVKQAIAEQLTEQPVETETPAIESTEEVQN
jgi:hypothetical protein